MKFEITPMNTELLKLAVFDVDDTLIQGDSFIPFLARLGGWPQTITGLTIGLITAPFRDKDTTDFRTFLKATLIAFMITGSTESAVRDAAEKLRIWRRWNPAMHNKLFQHHQQGHHIVIASGGLDLYLPEILKDIPYNSLICTEIDIKNGIVTGDMTNGNCVRARKAELVKAYIEQHGPFGESWGYGNYPHDVPMLKLVKHQILV